MLPTSTVVILGLMILVVTAIATIIADRLAR
jgi:hypothetical protein